MPQTKVVKTAPDRSEARRQKILDAAFDCFIRHGYSKVGINDIAAAAGLSRPLVYLSFEGKEDIFTQMFIHLFDEQMDRIKRVLASGVGARQKIVKVFQIVFLDVWTRLSNSLEHDDLFDATNHLFPKIGAKYRRQLAQELSELVGDTESGELLILAVKGLSYDRPSTPVLRRRITALVSRFVPDAAPQ